MKNPLLDWVLSAPDQYDRMDRILGTAIVIMLMALALIFVLRALGVQ